MHAILYETGLSAERLQIEITEGALIDDFSRAVAILRRLKAMGVRIAMDDFGTGYSSLSYLQSFPFDLIKIDRAFISNVDCNAQSAAIVRAVIGLARGLNVPVIAEGVETKGELDFLAQEACSEAQGYLTAVRSRSTAMPTSSGGKPSCRPRPARRAESLAGIAVSPLPSPTRSPGRGELERSIFGQTLKVGAQRAEALRRQKFARKLPKICLFPFAAS